MLKWLISRRLTAFERHFDYDLNYARQLLVTDFSAFLAMSRVMSLARYRRDVPVAAYYAAKLAGTLAEDCGSCVQLVVAMALQDGVHPDQVRAVLSGDEDALEPSTRLALRFARAVLGRSADAAPLRDELSERHGPRAVISLGFAVTSARIFPTLKYALGHAHSCERILVAGTPVVPAHLSA